MRRLILASTSPYRRELLKRLRVPFECIAPDYEEVNPPDAEAQSLVESHAVGKARSVAQGVAADVDGESAVIIGSDQVMSLAGEVLGKPGSKEAARSQLRRMARREHELITALALVTGSGDVVAKHTEVSPIAIRELSDEEIERYVEAENPVDCAGSYKCEALGISLFEYQRGDDPTAVVGLPLIALSRLLRDAGFAIP